jgi:hypothetical protein
MHAHVSGWVQQKNQEEYLHWMELSSSQAANSIKIVNYSKHSA